MCGICCYIGLKPGFEHVYHGIRMLQNRGYDSAGICSIQNNQYICHKYPSESKLSAIERLGTHVKEHKKSHNLISHSRWRTVGAKSKVNSHPHMDYKNRFTLVHNGIIENYAKIKKELVRKHKIPFRSQTDSEVIVNLISYYYDKSHNPKQAIADALSRLEGTWGLVIQCLDTPNSLYCARHGSPLLVGFSDTYMMVASEQSGFCKYVDNYICLKNNDVVVLNVDDIGKQVLFEKYDVRRVTVEDTELTPYPYPHWTLKEIYEQYDAANRAMGMGGRLLDDYSVKLGGLEAHTYQLMQLDHIIILGCGTSYHAGLYSINIFKEIAGLDTVHLYDGADFTKYDIPKVGRTGLILLSQSGETKDLHRCIDLGREIGLFMIGIINAIDSLIARDVHCGIYLNAGREVAVASTKAFTSQVIVLHMTAVWFAQNRKINEVKRKRIIEGLRRLPLDIQGTISSSRDTCRYIAKQLLSHHSLFILGKGNCVAVAKEGALKIKEIGYINANGYSSSCLKHGTYSLFVEGTPAIIIAPNDQYLSKNSSIIDELVSRGGSITAITDNSIPKTDRIANLCNIPTNDIFIGVLGTIPMQLIAYELAVLKGHSPDRPRNLAKCVTVD